MQSSVFIGGKLRPFKFGTNATAIFCKEFGCNLGEFNTIFSPEKMAKQQLNGDEIVTLIYAGLCAGCYSLTQQPDFTKWNIGDWIDELKPEQLAAIFESIGGGVKQGTNKTVAKKKK
jgi:hypothetical protein